jgi:hypothetical protein
MRKATAVGSACPDLNTSIQRFLQDKEVCNMVFCDDSYTNTQERVVPIDAPLRVGSEY